MKPVGARASWVALGAAAAVAFSPTACHRTNPTVDSQEPGAAPEAPPQPPPPPPPVDHLAAGELIEGPVFVLGVPLPQGMQLRGSFVDVAYASGPLPLPAVVRYFRARVESGTLHESAQSATFEHVRPHGKPGADLSIHVASAPGATTVEVRNAAPPTLPALADEPSRWKAVGLTPQGRLSDPRHLD